jgi:hypothetical protein
MLRQVASLAFVLIASSMPASAQGPFPFPPPPPFLGGQGTPEERAACEDDVHRYCEAALPDVMRVAQCLQINRPKISASCRQVLANRGL